MGTYHMAILLLFESADQLSYKDLQESTRLTDEQLTKHLQSLLDAKIIEALQPEGFKQVEEDKAANQMQLSTDSIQKPSPEAVRL